MSQQKELHATNEEDYDLSNANLVQKPLPTRREQCKLSSELQTALQRQ
jgi:hypothetical protein